MAMLMAVRFLLQMADYVSTLPPFGVIDRKSQLNVALNLFMISITLTVWSAWMVVHATGIA